MKYATFTEAGWNFVVEWPCGTPLAFPVKATRISDGLVRETTSPVAYEPRAGIDAFDAAELEKTLDLFVKELVEPPPRLVFNMEDGSRQIADSGAIVPTGCFKVDVQCTEYLRKRQGLHWMDAVGKRQGGQQ